MPGSKDITRLRKEKQLSQALKLAENLYEFSPEDVWVQRAYSWVLYDLCKEAITGQNYDEARKYLKSFDALCIAPDDEMIHENFDILRKRASPDHRVLEQARQLDKNGQHLEALKLFYSVEAQYKRDANFQDAYGWSIHNYLKKRLESGGKLPEFIKLLTKYNGLANAAPSRLHSRIARSISKITKEHENFPLLNLFENWLAKGGFMAEDYKPNLFEGKTYASLVEKIAMQIGQKLLEHPVEAQVDKFMPLLDEAIRKCPENIWLPYYKAKVLIQINREQEALRYLVPVVKEKRNEYWSWALLGDSFRKNNIPKAISCYSKALLCKADEKFLSNVRSDFAGLLHQQNLLSEAKTEYTIAIKTKRDLGTRMSHRLSSVEQEAWFQATASKPHNRDFYQKNKDLAESILFDDIPWRKATVGESFTTPKEPDILKTKIYFKERTSIGDILVKDKQFGISKRFKAGESVRIKAEENKGRWVLYQLEERQDGTMWDLFPESIAVIDYIRPDKGFAHFIADTTIQGIIKPTSLPELQTGAIIRVRYKSRLREGKAIYEALYWTPTNQLPASSVYKPVTGAFRQKQDSSFGFVDDVFVPPELINQHDLIAANGLILNGKAVLNFNEKKNSWGWKMVSLDT